MMAPATIAIGGLMMRVWFVEMVLSGDRRHVQAFLPLHIAALSWL